MRLATIRKLYRMNPPAPSGMGFSIGGWHPFSGGLTDVLEGGTINGQTVFSGGLAGLAQHLDQIAQGVNVSLLGGDLGGQLNNLVAALDAPVIHGTEWIDKHKEACIAVVAIVGIAILAPYAFAAWGAVAGEGTVDAAIVGVDSYDAAMIAIDSAATAADQAAIAAAAEAAASSASLDAFDAAMIGTDAPAAAVDSYDAAMIATDASGYDAATAAENISIQNAASQEAANAAADMESAQSANDAAQIANEAGGTGAQMGTGSGTTGSMLGTSGTAGTLAASPFAQAIENAVIGTGTSALIGAGMKAAGLGPPAPVQTYAPASAPSSNKTLLYLGIAAALLGVVFLGGGER